jgi:hypothetical protein
MAVAQKPMLRWAAGGVCCDELLDHQPAGTSAPLLAAPAYSPQASAQRFRCVLGMLSSSEVKVLCPT